VSKGRTISASEIGHYTYCPRAWWLGRVLGYAPENTQVLEAGATAHGRHGRGVRSGLRWRFLAWVFIAIGVLAGLALLGVLLVPGG
jgi:hypothetical protein